MPGRHWETFEVGAVIEHTAQHTITQEDNAAFCRLTLNTQPLHLDEAWARRESPFGRIVVNGILTFAAAVGLSVRDLTEGTLVANLSYADVQHPAPVFPGDTIRARTEVLEKRLTSKPGRGLVRLRTHVTKQDGTEVCRFERTVLVVTKDPRLVKAEA